MTNYFMTYRPFHLDYAKRIIVSYCSENRNTLVNHFAPQSQGTEYRATHQVIEINGGFFKRVLGIRKVRKELKQIAERGEDLSVYIPHTLGILSNYAYYSLAGKYKNVKINVFYEGIIVFYHYQHNYLPNLFYYTSRFLISLAAGFIYGFNKNLLNLKDPRINKIYTPFLNIDAPAEKLVETHFDKISYEPLQDTAIVLGSILQEKYSEDMVKIIRAMYTTLRELKVKNIFFKDHPVYENEFFRSVAGEMDLELKYIQNTNPIESIVKEYAPGYIMSIWSSGIINMSAMLPGGTKMFCFVTERLLETEESRKIIKAFEERNIQIVYA